MGGCCWKKTDSGKQNVANAEFFFYYGKQKEPIAYVSFDGGKQEENNAPLLCVLVSYPIT